MTKLVVTVATLQEMAQKCARTAERRGGLPVLEDAGELLLFASYHVADLERRLEEWERLGKTISVNMPSARVS